MTSGVNIPSPLSETCTQTSDDLAFECEQIAEQAEATAARAVTLVSGSRADASREVDTLADLIVETNLLIASTNRNMARMMNRG